MRAVKPTVFTMGKDPRLWLQIKFLQKVWQRLYMHVRRTDRIPPPCDKVQKLNYARL
jgi:hypothetical protein